MNKTSVVYIEYYYRGWFISTKQTGCVAQHCTNYKTLISDNEQDMLNIVDKIENAA